MVKGLYISALGMTTQMQRMDVVSNNIANVNTTGYKRDTVASRSFAEELTRRLNDDSAAAAYSAPMLKTQSVGRWSQGVYVDDVYADFSAGALQRTDAPLDLAVTGNGFFTISTTGADGNVKEMYTRDGAFTLGTDGALLTSDGDGVLGLSGPVRIPDGNITIDAQGRIMSNGAYVDTLRMADFTDYHTLRKAGGNLYDVTAETAQTPWRGGVEQGFLEASNANAVREMVEMIAVSRAYEANQRVIQTHDTTLQHAVNDIGRKQ